MNYSLTQFDEQICELVLAKNSQFGVRLMHVRGQLDQKQSLAVSDELSSFLMRAPTEAVALSSDPRFDTGTYFYFVISNMTFIIRYEWEKSEVKIYRTKLRDCFPDDGRVNLTMALNCFKLTDIRNMNVSDDEIYLGRPG